MGAGSRQGPPGGKPTERAEAERRLRVSEERYRRLFETAQDGILLLNGDSGRVIDVNPFLIQMLGCQSDELLGKELWELGPFTDRSASRAAFRQLQDTGYARYEDLPLQTRAGELRQVEFVSNVYQVGDQKVIQCNIRDITERHRTEGQLRLQAAALQAAANAIVITDRDGLVWWVNPAFTTLTGYARDEVLGQTLRILKSGQHDRAFYAAMWTTILAGQVWQGELTNRRRDGTLYTERETITPVGDADGPITHFIAIKEDVTAQKRAEAELQRHRDALYQSEKLAAMGQLLAGVAHELNNPLAVVVGEAYLLRHKAEGPLARRAQRIGDAAERCARIVKNFLDLARQYPPERHAVELNRVVREAVELLAYSLRVDGVEVVYDLDADLPSLWADPHQLQQVVVNLVTNAHDAMRREPGPRRLTLSTRTRPEGAGVRLEVADTGRGIAPEIRRRLFEPFFTTKAEGTGLGLPLCRAIIASHGGIIDVDSEPGPGARFRVELPLGGPRARTAEASPAEAGPPPVGKRILVVDDETSVGDLLVEILDGDGHQVDRALNGRAALEKLRERAYDLILSDMRMPELDGPGLYREVARRAPDLGRRFVFLTGDVVGPDGRELIEQAGVPTLTKPFGVDEVRRIVREMLQRPG